MGTDELLEAESDIDSDFPATIYPDESGRIEILGVRLDPSERN